jgi:hypothetical protein
MHMAENRTAKHLRTYRVLEAVGVFANPDALEAAVDELENAGFDRASISVLGSDDEIKKRIGRFYHSVAEIEDDMRAPRASLVSLRTRFKEEATAIAFPLYVGGLAGVAAVVASGGALALAIAAAIIGSATGASLGGLLASAIAEHHAKQIEELIAQGGLVLWVKIADDDATRRALAVLENAGARNVHIHEIRRRWGPGSPPIGLTDLSA